MLAYHTYGSVMGQVFIHVETLRLRGCFRHNIYDRANGLKHLQETLEKETAGHTCIYIYIDIYQHICIYI